MCAADDPNFVRLDMWLGQDKDKFMIPKKKLLVIFMTLLLLPKCKLHFSALKFDSFRVRAITLACKFTIYFFVRVTYFVE
jgi:hypothetical protein